jgi:hypothetical protein
MLDTDFKYGEKDFKNSVKKEHELSGSRPFNFLRVNFFCNLKRNLKSAFFIPNLHYVKKVVICYFHISTFQTLNFKAKAHETARMWKNLLAVLWTGIVLIRISILIPIQN